MLKYTDYDIVFQEIPNEVTLAITLSNCPNRCKGCHSPQLMDDIGEELTEKVLLGLLEKYGKSVTCICFMGGDASPLEVGYLASFIKKETQERIKTGWYSGRTNLVKGCEISYFDFIKLGPYIEALGGLDSPKTNQRLYQVRGREYLEDITKLMQK